MTASDFFSSAEGRFLFDLILALIFGFLIGVERELRGKDAGISTHVLVITGSMIYTFLSTIIQGGGDQSRIAAQVVTGIGFLGAGIILKSETGGIRNLTTAASIWYSGSIGMALGFDYHSIAFMATVACVLIPRFPNIRKFSDPGRQTGVS